MPQKRCYPSSLCLLLFPILLLSSGSAAPNPYNENCYKNLRCGNISVTYPFRLLQSSNYCGYPGYELSCSSLDDENAQLTIKLDEKDYVVQHINYVGRILGVVDSYFMETDCPLSFTSTSINSTLYNYASSDSNFKVYLNCSFQDAPPGLSAITCLNELWHKKSYYKVDYGPSNFLGLAADCELTAAVPVQYNTTAPFEKALKEGFELTWNYSPDWCQGCMASGGTCGYNETRPGDQICFCSDTNRLGSCYTTNKRINKGLIIAGEAISWKSVKQLVITASTMKA